MRSLNLKPLFFVALAFVSLFGSITNGAHLAHDFYIRPLVRFVGYGSLLVYSLLMLYSARYNSGPLTTKEDRKNEN